MTVVDKQTALDDLDRFAEEMGLDLDTSSMDEEDIKSLDKLKGQLVKAMQDGHLVIDGEGQAVFTPSHPKSKDIGQLIFKEPRASSFMSMDRTKKNQDFKKLNMLIAEMVGQDVAVIGRLYNRDYKIVQAIVMLFLG